MSVRRDQAFDIVVVVLLIIVGLAAVVPLLIVVSASLTPYGEVLRQGGYSLIPHDITLDGYRSVFADGRVRRAFGVTGFVTVVGTTINLVVSVLLAYPLSVRQLAGRRFILLAVLLTTLFSAGIIPTYLVVKQTGLLNTVWAMIIPTTVSVFNVLILRTFFAGIPESVVESARIDGAGELTILLRIVLPLSVPVLMTVGLFYAVGHWNTFMAAVLYIRDSSLQPLQVVLRQLLSESGSEAESDPDAIVPTVTFRMAAVVVIALPMIIVYPFIQRYFRHGVMIGSVKG